MMQSLIKSTAIVTLLASLAYGASGEMISGIVKDPSGKPLKGVFVHARSATKTKTTISVLSDKQGHYRIEKLSPGRYDVWTTALDYQSAPPVSAEVTAGKSTSRDFALQKGMLQWGELTSYQMAKLLPEGKGREKFETCLAGCHGVGFLTTPRRDERAWLISIKFMRELFPWINRFTDAEAAELASYATSLFGVNSKLPTSPAELPQYQEIKQGEFGDEAMKIVYVDYELPKPRSMPWSGAPDKDGKIWIPEYGKANRIGRLDPNTGEVQEFPVPYKGVAAIHSAIPAPDGTVWLVEQGPNKIGRWDPRTQTITEFQSPYAAGKEGTYEGGSKNTIRVDPRGDVFTSGRPLARFDPKAEKFTFFSEPTEHQTYGLALDKEGSLWFTELRDGKIGKVDAKTGKLTRYDVPTPKAVLRRIQVDRNGIVWFGEYEPGKIGRFDPKTETFKEYQLPGPRPTPYALGIDENNQIWYSSEIQNVIGRLDPKSGQVTEYPFPYPANSMRELFLDSQGRMWFGTPANNRVAYFYLVNGAGKQ